MRAQGEEIMTVTNVEERLRLMGLMSPIDPEAANRWRPAPRLDTLHGKVGGFLGNRKANAALLLHNVRELMDRDLELGDSLAVDKYVYSRPAAEDIIEELATGCDFVVTAHRGLRVLYRVQCARRNDSRKPGSSHSSAVYRPVPELGLPARQQLRPQGLPSAGFSAPAGRPKARSGGGARQRAGAGGH